ncbi:hypothetical protein L3X38_007100 [Prunus dulcis]|uniref:Uncharacterized protein n=1 Tax=Prunus dulcis TaxID=3755 RepID=A0AAD4ZTV6_PRUDU|nr:hypothetical protein L3X38_007100 [Prunus dulcis]
MVVEIRRRNAGEDPMLSRSRLYWLDENHNKTKTNKENPLSLKIGEEVKGGREEGRGGKNNGFLPPQSGKEYTILIFAYPVGNYHKGRKTLNLYVEDKLHKATPGGTGGVKLLSSLSPTTHQLPSTEACKGVI